MRKHIAAKMGSLLITCIMWSGTVSSLEYGIKLTSPALGTGVPSQINVYEKNILFFSERQVQNNEMYIPSCINQIMLHTSQKKIRLSTSV